MRVGVPIRGDVGRNRNGGKRGDQPHLDGVMRIAVASTSPRPCGPMALDGQGHASPPAISPTRPTLHTIPSQMRRAKCMHCVESTGVVPCSSSDEQHVVANIAHSCKINSHPSLVCEIAVLLRQTKQNVGKPPLECYEGAQAVRGV